MKPNIEKLQEVENRLKHEGRRMYERYQTIRLYLKGNSVNQIASILKRTDKTIRTYIKTYEDVFRKTLCRYWTLMHLSLLWQEYYTSPSTE